MSDSMAEYKSPQQQIFDAVFLLSLNLGYHTYDFLPPKGAAYPFVYVGEQFDQDSQTKTSVYGRVQQTVHVFHTVRNRRDVTDMMDAIKAECRKLKRTENFHVTVKNITSQIQNETAGTEQLKHGIIEIDFQFN